MPGHPADVDLRTATGPAATRPVRALISLLAEAVIRHFGSRSWRDVLDRVGTLGFVRFDQYEDDDELLALLAAVPLPGDWTTDDRLRWLGCVAVPILAARYPTLFEQHRSPQSLLLALNEILQPTGVAGSGDPLTFEVEPSPSGELTIRYQSRRRLGALTVGFVEGTADHFGQRVLIDQPVCPSTEGGQVCLLECRFSPPEDVETGPWIEEAAPEETVATTAAPAARRRRPAVSRLWVFGLVSACIAAVFAGQQLIWRTPPPPEATWEHVFRALSVTWLIPLLPAGLALVGMLLFPWGRTSRCSTPSDVEVCFRVVSRGENRLALFSTIARIRVEMTAQPLFRYRIEVVTDVPVSLPAGRDVVHLVVPAHYQTAGQTLYKARALQYAVEHSDLPDDAWVVHLDEESQVTASAVRGICAAVEEEEAHGTYRIGQGAILYHRDLARYPLLTLADSLRTGDDVGRFYLQHRLGRTFFGLHGSFIVARNSVVKEIGFDFGPEGSITEDSFWALCAMGRGYESRWVDGFIEEQSTRSIMDFLRQRRRWFLGLILVVRRAPTARRWRAVLGASLVVWALAWAGILYTYAQLFVGVRPPEPIRWFGNFSFAVYVVLYLVGLRVNFDALGRPPGIGRWGWYGAQVGLMPVFALMEAAGVLYALVRPDFGFHVVSK